MAEAEAPAEPSDAKKPTREPGPSRLRKVRVAVVHGYRGSGYSGNTRSGSECFFCCLRPALMVFRDRRQSGHN